MAITANVTNGKLDKTNTTPTQNRKTSSAKASGSNLGYDGYNIHNFSNKSGYMSHHCRKA